MMRVFRFKTGLKLLVASALFFSTVACVESASREAAPRAPDSSKAVSDESQESTTPAPPKTSVDTTYRRPAGKTINVSGTGASAARAFQSALDSARPGDTIAIEPGSIIEGNFKLPAKKGDEWTVIRSSASDEKLPPEGKRVTPAMAGAMPKLVCPNPDPLISTAAGAHHYRFIGIEFSLAEGVAQNYGLIVLGDGTQKSLDALPHDLIVDRCYIHGNSSANLRRGIAMNSASTAIVDSYISDIHEVGADSQAICCWNGPGPFKIVNNYLEAAGENVMFGGADPSIAELVPSDIEFRHNHCFKPLTWMPSRPGYAGKHWTVKNIFELKNARRVHIEQNLFENNWLDGQSGFAILFTVRNQDGASPWSAVEDVTFINNVLRHSAAGIMFIGRDNNHPSQQVKRVLIANNLFADIGGTQWGNNGRWIQLTETDAVTIDHNTALQTGNLITAHGVPNQRFVYTNNISVHNEYGIIGDGTAPGTATLSKYFPAAVFKKNVIAGGRSNIYPGENFFPANIDEARFANRASDDYSLSAGSPYLNAGSDRKNLGCDMKVLKSVIDSFGAGRSSAESQ